MTGQALHVMCVICHNLSQGIRTKAVDKNLTAHVLSDFMDFMCVGSPLVTMVVHL